MPSVKFPGVVMLHLCGKQDTPSLKKLGPKLRVVLHLPGCTIWIRSTESGPELQLER